MLKFSSTDNAVFLGKEAEGHCQGLLTLFVVGNPPLVEVYKAMQWIIASRKNYGIYLGAGGCIDRLLSCSVLGSLLPMMQGFLFDRIAIECNNPDKIIPYIETIENWHRYAPLNNTYLDWIVPLVFGDYKMPIGHEEVFRLRDRRLRNGFIHFYGKVYIPNKVIIVAPLSTMHISANFDANEGEFANDQLLWKG